MMISLSLAFTLLILALIAGIMGGYALGRLILFHGSTGEALVANTISSLLSRPHVLVNNVTMKTARGTTQIDHLLVADTGIFVIETKHYQGWIFGGPNQSQWTQVIYKKRSRFQNPIRQNYAHLRAVQSIFTLPENHFIPIVVFTGKAEFKSNLGSSVVKLHELISFLTQERPVVLDERKMAYVLGRIEMKRERRSIETDEYHINEVKNRVGLRRGCP